MIEHLYNKEYYSAEEAQERAHLLAFAPVVFQVTRIMYHWGIFQYLRERPGGATIEEVATHKCISKYAAQVLLESSLTARTLLLDEGKYKLSKVGWFILTDPMVQVNMDFNHDVNYQGLFYLEEALREAQPAGLKVFGDWPTIYEGLSSLPEKAQRSWFAFDHFYSDGSFNQALEIIFKSSAPKRLLDVGGNTGRFAQRCTAYDSEVEVTILDLPQQLALMGKAVAGTPYADRISGHPINLLDPAQPFPQGFDTIWMSQLLDCFAEAEVLHILSRAVEALTPNGRLYIMETLWDRQKYAAAAFDIAQTSLYFTAMANGNSKMFASEDLIALVEQAGLVIDKIHDHLGMGHTLIVAKRS